MFHRWLSFKDRSAFKLHRQQLFAQTYTYDAIGNRERFATEDRGQKTEVSYQANALNQYSSLAVQSTSPGAEALAKDAVDSKTQPQSLSALDPSPSNLASSNFDEDGNLLNDGQNTYTWNAENRLIQVLSKDGTSKVTYTYDYQGRRTTKRQFTKPAGTDLWHLTSDICYIYDAWNLLAEIELPRNTDTPVRSSTQPEPQSPSASNLASSSLESSVSYYTFGPDLSGTLQGAGGVGGLLAITNAGVKNDQSAMVNHQFPCYDANGNIGQMINPKAELQAVYQYDAFGRVVDKAGEQAESNQWRFSTKPVEETTGWYYYGYRYYDPKTGRWPSRDPIAEKGGVNLYGFVENNALGEIDLFGLKPDCDKIKSCIVLFLNKGNGSLTGFETNSFWDRNHKRYPLPKEGANLPSPGRNGQWYLTSRWNKSSSCDECRGWEKILFVSIKRLSPQENSDWANQSFGNPGEGLGAGGKDFKVKDGIGREKIGLPSFGSRKFPKYNDTLKTQQDISGEELVPEARNKYKIEVKCDSNVIFERSFYLE